MNSIESVLDKLTDMPALPTVVAKLTRLISDPRTTASDINEAISRDPGLVTKILKLVNSSFYGFSRRITTITNAVVILGFNQVRNIALSSFIFNHFGSRTRDVPFDIKGFWKHSVGSAFISAHLARLIGPKLEEDAFICGLLHDLGKFIMAQHADDHMRMVVDLTQKNDILFHEAETMCLAYNHAQLGAVVMERWNLPEVLVEVVKNHHQPLASPENARALTCVVNAADICARALLMGSGGDDCIPVLEPAVWDSLSLNWTTLESLLRKAADDYLKSDTFFSTQ